MLHGVTPDPIQVLSMFDAGDSYMSPPSWVPFRHAIGWLAGVVIGRYIGGLLGYAPFYPEWTTDWAAACRKMKGHWTQARFAADEAQRECRARFISRGEGIGNEALYEEYGGYENWIGKKYH